MKSARVAWSRGALVMALYTALAAAGLGLAAWWGHPNIWRHPGHDGRPLVLLGVVAALLSGLAIVFMSRLAVHRYDWARSLHQDFRARLGPLSGGEILVLAGASSVGEEIFFRGALLPTLGLFGSSALFALLHIGPRLRYLPWTLSSFLAGLLFGQIFVWSGDLTGPVVAHFTVNFLNLRHLRDIDLR